MLKYSYLTYLFGLIFTFICLTINTNAQTIPEEVFWFKPTNLVPNSQNKIDSWIYPYSIISATQTDVNKQPEFNPDLLNGFPGIDLDGAQFLNLPDNIDFISGDKTFILLYRPTEVSYSVFAKGSPFSGSLAQNGDFALFPYQTNYRVRWREYDQPVDLLAPNLAPGNFYFIRIEIDRNNGLASFFINEALKDSVQCSQIYMGGNTTPDNSYWQSMGAINFSLNGSVSEIGLFSFANDAGETR